MGKENLFQSQQLEDNYGDNRQPVKNDSKDVSSFESSW